LNRLTGRGRLSNRSSRGANFRYGSNYPITGDVGERVVGQNSTALFGGARPLFCALTDARNALRLPSYMRLDVRADRAITWASRRVTLFVEVANVLNRRNVALLRRPAWPADGRHGPLPPIVASVGLVIESERRGASGGRSFAVGR
jgi:hypothetical protein